MKQDAEAHAEEDRRKKESVEEKNRAEQTAYAARRTLKEHGGKCSEDDRKAIEAACEQVEKAAKGDDVSEIRRAVEELEGSMHKLSKAMYEEAAKARGASAEPPPHEPPPQGNSEQRPAGGDDEVIDADYEVKD